VEEAVRARAGVCPKGASREFNYGDFADRVAQVRAESRARHGFSDASEGYVGMARERVNPNEIHFTQDTISPYFSDRPGTISDTIRALREGHVTPDEIPVIRVVEYNGKHWSLDNRRLAAFQSASLRDIPIERLSLRDADVLAEFRDKFKPIEGGRKIVVVPGKQKADARRILREYGKYSEY